MQIIKVKFLKDGIPSGRPYIYFSDGIVAVGDTVQINSSAKGIVDTIGVTESEILPHKDLIKTIVGKVEEKEQMDEPRKD